jgi:hypothetical protein
VLRIHPFEPLSIYEAVFNQPTLSNRRKLNGTRIWSLSAPAEETTGFDHEARRYWFPRS